MTESRPKTEQTSSVATMAKLLKVLGFKKWAKEPVRYEKDGKVEMIRPVDYLDRAGPMAKLMINNFLSAEQTDPDYPEQYAGMQAIMAGHLQLEQNEQGEWVRCGEPAQQ